MVRRHVGGADELCRERDLGPALDLDGLDVFKRSLGTLAVESQSTHEAGLLITFD